MLIVFEGVDGAGKSTQLKQLAGWLSSQGHSVVTCSDPGSTELGMQLRALLLGQHSTPIHMRTEMMMFSTARTQLVEEILKPALSAGKMVLLDRFVLSTIVYQGHAGNLDPAAIRSVNHFATDGLEPNLTLMFDLDVETSLQRVGSSPDRMESRGAEYFAKVRAGFLAETKRSPETIEVIDAAGSIDQIQTVIRERVSRILSL